MKIGTLTYKRYSFDCASVRIVRTAKVKSSGRVVATKYTLELLRA